MFISVDGPSGAGKSTIVRHLAQLLVAAGETVHLTAEPSNGPIGALCRDLTESVTGHSLAEVHFYRQATETLIHAGFDVLRVDCNKRSAEQSASFIHDQLASFYWQC